MAAKSILKVSIRQVKAARSLLAWSQEELAAAANVSIPTIKRLEAEDGPLGLATIKRAEAAENETSMTTANDLAVRRALEAAGVEFIDEDGGGAGVRLRKRHQKKS